MDLSKIFLDIILMFWASLKFLMFAPVIAATHTFKVGLILNIISGFTGITTFYFLSDYFMRRTLRRRIKREKSGKAKPKKTFTRVNKFLVRSKRSLGMIGLALITPTGISIPIGSIIMAKFYKHSRWAYPSLVLSMILWAVLITSVASFFPDLFNKIFPNAGS